MSAALRAAWKGAAQALASAAPVPASSRPRPGALVLVACLALLTWLPRLRGPIDLRFDGGVYYVLGVSLAEGKGYRLLNEPGEISAVQYPPLLPLLVAAHVKVLATDDPVVVGRALRLTYCALSVIYAIAVYLMARAYASDGLALAATVLTIFHWGTYYLSDLLFAEIPFACTATLFILVRKHVGDGRSWVSTLLGVSAVLWRTLGVALLVAWVAEAAARRRWGATLLRALVMALPLLSWFAYVRGVRSGPEYASPAYGYQRAAYMYYNVSYGENMVYRDPFRPELGYIAPAERITRALRYALRLPMLLGEAVSAPQHSWEWMSSRIGLWFGYKSVRAYQRLATGLLGLLVMAGLTVSMVRGERMLGFYVASTVALVFTTPWPAQFTRYMAPLTPVLAVGLVVALDAVRRLYRPRRWPGVAIGAVAVGIAAVQAAGLVHTVTRNQQPHAWPDRAGRPSPGRLFYYDEGWRAFDASLRWLAGDARREDVVVTSTPHHVYLRTGLKSVMLPMEADSRLAQRLLDGVPVRYLVVDGMTFGESLSRRYLSEVARRSDLWELRYSGEGALRIYQRRVAPAP